MPAYYQPFDIYREELSSQYHGLALWDPNPVQGLFSNPDHVSIGDVGYLHNGAFVRIFNVKLPRDDPSNKFINLPEGHKPLEREHFSNIRHSEVRKKEYHSHVSIVDNFHANTPDDLGQTYECWAQSHGALLYLPHGAHSEDAIRTRLFEDYIRDNADSWLRWSKNGGLPVENVEDLILVTGYTLAKSWAIAAFDGTTSRDGDATTISLEVQVSDDGGAQFFWRDLRGNVEYHHSNSNIERPENQCVFIRGFRAKRVLFGIGEIDGVDGIGVIGLLQIRSTLLRIGSTLLRYGTGKSPQRSPYQGPREIGLRNRTSSSSLDTIGPQRSPYRQSTPRRNDGSRDASYGDDLFIGGSSSRLNTIGPQGLAQGLAQGPPYRHPTLQRNNGVRNGSNASFRDDSFIGSSSSSLDMIGSQRPPYRHPTVQRNHGLRNASYGDSLIGGPSSNLRRIGPPINHENLQLLPYPSSTAIQSNGDLDNASFMTSPSDNSLIEVQNDADKVAAVKPAVVIQQAADGLADMKRNQLRQDLHRWLSPPDPSANHNTARNVHHEGTANWFFQGRFYNEWKSIGSESLLWIHGKPGSGKTVLCSTIIHDIKAICDAGQASMAYFYFDFRDINKQHWRDLVSSLLTQFSSRSHLRCDILSHLYTDHVNGVRYSSDDALTQCLKEMLTLPDQYPTYLIIDALDECSNISGIPIPRKRVLQFLKELVDLHIPNLHICVTSRPEVDIRDVLEPLTSRRVSLHDQVGQKKDIEDYVRSVVYSNSEPIMRRWRKEDKELVIEILSERADGMFRWTFCQLEVLRYCLPSSVRRTLDELPESLDATYERILKEIMKPNRAHARRVLQCLVVAIRPLRVVELAEVLAVDFDDTEGIPRLKADWLWEDEEKALLIACSSLIAIVDAGGSRVVQFSHFSVKEFLTSPRLAIASGEVSNYYINLEPAHTILGQACLGVLLQIQDDVEGCTPEDHPLVRYAAEHWTTHARFGEVSSRLHKGMEYLFDGNKPHFKVWLTLCDIDTGPNLGATFYLFTAFNKSPATPLYYAALCGFHDLVEHLITKHSQDVNADGGYYMRPLVAALAKEHFQTADLLRHNGADPDIWGYTRITPLQSAAYYGSLEVVRKLIEYGADIDTKSNSGQTSLHRASYGQSFKDGSVLRLLLEHGADINVRDTDGWTPLYSASKEGALEVVRLLLEHGADVEARANYGKTALQVAAEEKHDEVVELLRQHGAK